MSETLDKRLNAFRPDLADRRLEGRVAAQRFVDGVPRRVIVPIADLRRRPGRDAPLETQALFGEDVLVFEDEGEGWAWVQLAGDGYVGWMESEALGASSDAASQWCVGVPRTFLFPGPDIKQPPLGDLPMGARLAVRGEAADHNAAYLLVEPLGAVVRQHARRMDDHETDFVAVAERFRHVPYLWGGKSALGIDCSGLMQLAAAMAGIAMPRDTDMQEAWAEAIDAQGPRRRGDLVFWRGHVGVMLDAERLLHANAYDMMTAVEPLAEAAARAKAKGSTITRIGRVPGSR